VIYFLRHVLAVLMLPATVVVFVPIWIARRYGVRPDWPDTPLDVALACAGVVLMIPGLLLFGASLHHFFVTGKGTLAPWDPPRHLVVRGPYRYVRNPMIGGVIFMVFALALLLRSRPHAMWALTFLFINAVYIPLYEEPSLAHRFGAEYERYRRNVGRFMPRLTAWEDAEPAAKRDL
jgi:protein-S-isoprenylcysteine O-methyltransferase Ste14